MSCGKCLFDPPKPPYGAQYQGARVTPESTPEEETPDRPSGCGHAECAAAEAAPHTH